jgi:hypothetical protein
MIGFIGTFITITLNYSHLYQLTIGDCLRLLPFLTGLRVSSLPLWLTWFWFTSRLILQPVNTPQLNTQLPKLTNESLRLQYDCSQWLLSYDSSTTAFNDDCLTSPVRLLLMTTVLRLQHDCSQWRLSYDSSTTALNDESAACPPFITRCEPKREHYFNYSCIRLFHPLSREHVSIPQQPIRCVGKALTEPLSSNGLFRLSGFLTHSLSRKRV